MRKIFILFFFVLFIALAIVFWNHFLKRFGDLRPAFLPSIRDITNDIEDQDIKTTSGEPVSFPLHLPKGFTIKVFSKNIANARDIKSSPGGVLLVSETSEGKVVALPDKNNNGKADEIRIVLSDLLHPHGIAFYNNKLFVAEENRVVRYNWNELDLTATFDKVLFELPKSMGGHFTRSIVFDKKGNLFVSIGSTCNVCAEPNPWYASIIVSDDDGNNPKVFAGGLRNSVFMTVDPKTDEVWATEMGRDYSGDELPPDEINIIRNGKNYGWPHCYGNRVHDDNFELDAFNKISPCDERLSEPPVFEIPAHSAPLGLAFIDSSQFPKDEQGDLLVAYHGSWNRSVPTGYKVVHMKVKGDTIISAEDFLTGFLQGSSALGRPVDLEFDSKGNLYISDDKAGAVYILTNNTRSLP